MRSRRFFYIILSMLLFSCAHGPTKQELRETPIPEFLENNNGVLIPVPTAEGTGFPNYIKIFSLSDDDIRKMQPGGASKFAQSGTGKAIYYSLGLLTNPLKTTAALTVGAAAGLGAGAVVHGSETDATGTSNDDMEPPVRMLSKEESSITIAEYTALRKAGYENSMALVCSEYALSNNIRTSQKIRMIQLQETLFSFYIYRKLGGLANYQKFRKKNYKNLLGIEEAYEGQPSKNNPGRQLTPEELNKIYYDCFIRIDSGEKIQFRKALIEYRVNNNIPSQFVSVGTYRKCLMAYADEQPHVSNDFLEFEYDYLKALAS